MKQRIRVPIFVLLFTLIFAFSAPSATNAASLHTNYYAHTIKTAVYHYSRSGKSKVRGHIASHKTLRVNKYYKSWYKVIWGKRYVWVYKKYVRKGKYVASSSTPVQTTQTQTITDNATYPKTIILPDGGKIIEYSDGSHYNPDPSEGGSSEPVALQVAQAEVIDLGGGNITANSDGSYTVIVPKELIAAEAKKNGAKIIDYPDGSYAVYYSHKTNSFDDPIVRVDVRDDGSYTNTGISVVMPDK